MKSTRLKTLRIKNFRVHKSRRFRLARVTTIVGPTDRGKTAVLSALRWLATNRPAGESFRTWGAEGTTVVNVEGPGISLCRRKGSGGVNTYSLNGTKYKAFGADPPLPVQEALNLGEVNFQGQHDSPYWFLRTAGEVSRELNAIVDLALMDRTMANVAKELTGARNKAKEARERLDEARRKKSDLNWVLEAASEWKSIEGYHKVIQHTIDQVASIRAVMGQWEKHQKAAAEGLLGQTVGRAALFQADLLNKKREENRELRELVQGIQDREDKLCRIGKSLIEAQRRIAKVSKCPLCGRRL